MDKSTFKVVGKTIDCLVALNTLQSFRRAAKRGVYFDSPDRNEFDGSAEGYWERVARQLGATDEEITHCGE